LNLVILRHGNRECPILSGVGYTPSGYDDFHVPYSQDAKYTDDPPPEPLEVTAFHPLLSSELDNEDYAYLIHAHCWNLLECTFGFIIRSELATLVHVLRARWVDEDYGGAKRFCGSQWKGGRNEPESSIMFVTDPLEVPEILTLMTRWTTHEDKALEVKEYDRSLGCLPMELKLMILDCLDYSDVQRALSVLGWKAPAQYWKGRFRSDLFFEVKSVPPQAVNWFSLWLASEHLLHHYPPLGLANRCRILTIVRAVVLDLNSYRRIYQPLESSIDLDCWSVIFKSARINELANIAQVVSVPSTVRKLNFSFVKASESDGFLLSGIKFLPEGSTLGYCLLDEALSEWATFSVPTTLSGIMVKLDAKGVRDIMPMCKDFPSNWIMGFSDEDSSVGVLFDDEDSAGIEICAMIDVRLMESSQPSSMLNACLGEQVHCYRLYPQESVYGPVCSTRKT